MLQYLETNRLLEEQKENAPKATMVRQGEAFINEFLKTSAIHDFYFEWLMFATEGVLQSKTDTEFCEFLSVTGLMTDSRLNPEKSLVMTASIFWQVFRMTFRICQRVERCYQFHYGRTPGPIADFLDDPKKGKERIALMDDLLSDKGIETLFGADRAPYFIAKAKKFIEIGETYPVHSKDDLEKRRQQIRCATALRLCLVAVNFKMTAVSGRIWIEDYGKLFRAALRVIKKMRTQGTLIDAETARYFNKKNAMADLVGSLRTSLSNTVLGLHRFAR